MEIPRKLENYCNSLESNKITVRRQACDDLIDYLQNKTTIDFLNSKGADWWSRVLNSIQSCLAKDGDKKMEECRKKRISDAYIAPKSADLFVNFVKIAVKELASLNFRRLTNTITDSLKDDSKRCYQQSFLKILQFFLTNNRIRSELNQNDWENIYLVIKFLCEKTKISDPEQIKCLTQIIKWGPLYKFPVDLFRREFDFVAKLCGAVSSLSPKPQQEAVIELAYEFCKHAAKDNRMACCKLGEEILTHLLELYETNSNEDKMKVNLVELFLLQVVMHHPQGVQKNHPAAYAVNWNKWLSCLQSIYSILTKEIEASLEFTIRNQSFFIGKNDSKQLLDVFTLLFVEVCRQLFDNRNISMQEVTCEPPRKRQRLEVTLKDLIEKIKNTKSWIWISLTSSVIRTYPDMITDCDYLELITIMVTLQSECKDVVLKHHIYKTLLVLEKIEIRTQLEIDHLWKTVADSSLKSIGMGQNDDLNQILMRNLIIKRNMNLQDPLFENYRSESALPVTVHNLKTLDAVFKHCSYLQSDNNLKTEIMKWILSSNWKNFSLNYLAEVLVCLILKQWPNNKDDEISQSNKPFKDVEDVYLSTSLENLIISPTHLSCENVNLFCPDQSLFNILVDLLIDLSKNLDIKENIEILLNLTILYFNVLSYLLKCNLLKTSAINSFNLFELFEMCSKSLFSKISVDLNKIEERNLEKVTEYVQNLNLLFSTNINSLMVTKLREVVPEDLIRAMFISLNTEFKEMRRENVLKHKKVILQTLVSFSCLPNAADLLQMQKKALECLVTNDYTVTDDEDFELVVTLIHSITLCKPVSLCEATLSSVFSLIQNICECHYHCYLSAVKVLELFNEIYPFVVNSGFDDCKNQFVQLLYLFYNEIGNYGPNVSVNLLKCVGLIYELEPDKFYQWGNDEIAFKVPVFLTSEYQEVRFVAIETIVQFYKTFKKTYSLQHYHRQEIMFSKIVEMSIQVFQIEGNLSRDRIVDETVTRTSCILHTFACIMLTSYLWIEDALFTLFKIVCDKNIDLSHLNKIIEMVAKNLGFDNRLQFLEKYLLPIFTRWKTYDINTFPFPIFDCDTKIIFFTKYWHLLAPVIVNVDKESIGDVAKNLGKSNQEILEDSAPQLLSYCMAEEVKDFKSLKNNQIYRLLCEVLSVSNLHLIFKNKIEEVILNLVELISDESNFKETFNESIIFSKFYSVRLTVDEFQECVEFIENSIFEENSLFVYLIQNHLEKIHLILLDLNLKITVAKALEEKLRYFHIYSIISQTCIDVAMKEIAVQPYLIRNLIYTLLHFIKNYKAQPDLSHVSCILLKKILRKIVPDLVDVLKQFFLIIVSRLKNIALENNGPFGDLCVDMLQFLIVDHGGLFIDEIEKLDSIPEEPRFIKMHSVHYNIKYSNKKVNLEDEIKQFLEFSKSIESFDECEHSLKHLQVLLSNRKDELRDLYDALRKTRGFSEDCKDSILHKLICVLVTLSCSTNQNVSMEAVRCLGEIGPADLSTLILQSEKPPPSAKWGPRELILGHAISLLSKYLVDSDVHVIKTASSALFYILSSKEGRKVSESEIDSDFGTINLNYLRPFFTIPIRKTNLNVRIDGEKFMTTMENDDLWIPQHKDHQKWISELVCGFLQTFQEDDLSDVLINIAKSKSEFCEQILPPIIFMILYLESTAVTNLISVKIRSFFDKHWIITVIENNEENESITTNKSSVQCMLNVVHFVRLQSNIRAKRTIEKLNLDYLKIAKAAHFCSAHFTAILYAELWCQNQINVSEDYHNLMCSFTKLDLILENVDELTGKALQDILRKAYKSVGEVDALLGCGTSYLLNPQCRVEHYKELGRWDQVMHRYEIEVSHGKNSSLASLMDSLKRTNFYQLSLFCSNSLGEPHYESLWRLGQWDYNKPNRINYSHHNAYDKYKFYTFKALHDNDEFNFKQSLNDVRLSIIHNLSSVSLESSKNIYHILTQLQSLKEIEDFATAVDNNKICELLIKWEIQDQIIENDFQYVEPIKAQRIVLLTEFLKKNPQKIDEREIVMDSFLKFAEYARIEGNPNVAFRTLETLRLLSGLSNDIKAKIQFEEAQLCWSIQDVISAKCILRQLCSNENVNPRLHAMALKMTGKWMVESSSENRQVIIENYFQKSLNLLRENREQTLEDEKAIQDTFYQLAKFSDREYQQVMTHIKSDIFQKKLENIEKAKQVISNVSIKNATRDLKKAVMIKEKQNNIDKNEITNIENEKNSLLQFALKYYLLNLIRSDDHDITVFRLISLLLENRNNNVINSILRNDLLKIPSHKFINILPQMIPHISGIDDLFCETVKNVVEKCAKDHPYHTLPLILSLALSNKDRDYAESKAVVNEARIQSADELVRRVKKVPNLLNLIKKMELLSVALIELAYYKKESDDDRGCKVPKKYKIRCIQDFDDVLLPTYNLPIDKTCSYSRIIGIKSFGDTYYNVGGINAPKRIMCKGTDGITRTQLVKGQDDLRQDAVMQQVFTIMNSLLALNKQTKNLLIRTYKIVPLSMRSGILEWVENTRPIGEYLTGERGDGGAHFKYRPMDKTPYKCRCAFKILANKTTDEKLRAFSSICKDIKPVFHHFFEETFPQPTLWYERRRAYIHSVATSSMIGYILGIGDRHVNNILIDKSTAEVVHIDFGIAFEQGRVLPTPETVPFRLSRDIVDGMGVSGVEGVFRRACEKTMEVLRIHHQTIVTILEVLLYDPLYDWTVSSAEANKRQKDEQDDSEYNVSVCCDEDKCKDVNVTAERALLRLKAKLQGTEDGKLATVEHQVGTLIQQAMDPLNLCRLFVGWQPYL